MTAKNEDQVGKKRKHGTSDSTEKGPFPDAVGLEMSSDDEGEQLDSGSDDGEVDEFPEINPESDSGEEFDSDEEAGDEDEGEEGDKDDENSGSESDLEIFPKAKIIISDITGEQKRVFPEIEPEYDSDSSTEDVRVPFLFRTYI
jgi:ribosome biogenesis protein ERB1